LDIIELNKNLGLEKQINETLEWYKKNNLIYMKYISKDFLIKRFQQEVDENGIFMKRDITRRLGTNHETLRSKFGSTDNFC